MATKKTKTTKKKNKLELEDLLCEFQERFNAIESKVDTLLSKTAVLTRLIGTERDPAFKNRASVVKKFPEIHDRDPRKRQLHKAVCAECSKTCEVPFVPKVGRPVYCKECYSSHRGENSSARKVPDRDEIVAEIVKTLHIDIPEPAKTKVSKTSKAKPKGSKAKVSKAKKPVAKTSKPKVVKKKKPKSKK
jgi:CxxC-x17-CxxC domain-containing protein